MMTMAGDEGRLREVLDLMRDHILSAYRRAVAYGYDPPMVALKIFGDWRRGARFSAMAKAVDIGDINRLSPTARECPGEAFEVVAGLIDVPPGHFRLVLRDEGDLCISTTLPIPPPIGGDDPDRIGKP
jgi:hypothetical protein